MILEGKLMAALRTRTLNPALPDVALQQARDELTRDCSALAPIRANRELYGLLKGGGGEPRSERVQVIDPNAPERNLFLAVQQFWMVSPDGLYTRRPDVIGFVR